MNKIYIILGLLFLQSFSPKDEAKLIDWKLLAKVEFKDHYFADFEAWYLVPEFSAEVKALNGQQVLIKGYMIPLDVEGDQYALSAYPFSACFFCGGAGPESVISLHFKEKTPRFDTDEYINVTGTLLLNTSDFDDFNYILKDCKAL
jgi:hypothetical protein